MFNIKFISPSKEGDVVEIISLDDAIEKQERLAEKVHGHLYNSRQEVIDDILACPTASITREEVNSYLLKEV